MTINSLCLRKENAVIYADAKIQLCKFEFSTTGTVGIDPSMAAVYRDRQLCGT